MDKGHIVCTHFTIEIRENCKHESVKGSNCKHESVKG